MSSSTDTEGKPRSKTCIESDQVVDDDARRLAEMGYVQEMKRGFSLWSVLGTGFSLTNSWFGISSAMITGIHSGGPVLLVYGIIGVAMISTCVGITLSELSSAYPNAGGQYFWAGQLAPRRYGKLASYLTGWFAYAGSIFTSASVALAMGSALVGMYQLTHPKFQIESWHVVVAYECFLFAVFFFNCWGALLPRITTATLWISLASFVVIIITVTAETPSFQSAKFVFSTFVNNTGWNNAGIAFIVGLINPSWSQACLDCATHLAEEVAQPERIIPIAIMGTIAIGFTTSFVFVIVMMFSIQDLASVTASPTLVPILEIFYQATSGSKAITIALEVLIVLTGVGCLTASHTWQSRLCWSFARDHGIPGHRYLRQIHPTTDTPLMAHAFSVLINALVGLLYLGSTAAFNSMVTATIVLLYVSYSIPTVCLLLRGRTNIPHGPFWLGSFGLAANCVLLTWTLFTLIMFSFPVAMPVTPGNMNYISAVYGVVGLVIGCDWFLRGRKEYVCSSAAAATANSSPNEQQGYKHSHISVTGAPGNEYQTFESRRGSSDRTS